MATITARPRQDGTVGYTAQIKIKRGGRVIFSQAATFDRLQAAKAWVARKEKELAKPGALDAARRPKGTVADLIDRYLDTMRKQVGRTKAGALDLLKRTEFARIDTADLRAEDIVKLARDLGQTRQPQTVQNYLSHLSAVLRIARAAWGIEIDRALMQSAAEATLHLGLTGKSASRSRRPTVDEMDRLMQHFADRSARRPALPMHQVAAFALFSTRRQEEILRITWADLEPGHVLVRDMKHPGQKVGNDCWCSLPPEAEAIARAMPRTDPRIFPWSTDAVSAAFTRACRFLDIPDLHFHDLRHEGTSRLFEMGQTIPQAASVTGHRSWSSLQRYAHLRQTGDKWAGWAWLDRVTTPQT